MQTLREVMLWNCFPLATVLVCAVSANRAVADAFGSGANTFDIEFVSIGNPGNAADTTGNPNPAGSVPYTYNMGKFDVSRDMITKANTLGSLGITLADMTPYGGNGVNRPATGVSWNEAARFINWLNMSTGSQPAYKFALQPGDAGYSANADIQLWTPSDAGYNANNLYRNSLARYFLPSVDEWYKAAYYDPTSGVYYNYPTGSDSAPAPVASGTAAHTAVYNQAEATGPADITLAGGLSPYGTMGQGGNVYQWEETDFDLVNGPIPGSSVRCVRGGGWNSVFSNVLLASTRTNKLLGPSDEGGIGVIGFRVASNIPEPSTLLLLGFGSLAALGRRRLACASILVAVVCAATSAHAADIRTVALSGQQMPGMPEGTLFGSFSFAAPVLNDAGQTAFLRGPGIWSEGTGSLALTARLGEHAPGTPDGVNFQDFYEGSGSWRFVISETGLTAFAANVNGTGSPGSGGIWSSGPGSSAFVARVGDQAAGVPAGVFYLNSGGGANDLEGSLLVNDTGHVAFQAPLYGSGVDGSNYRGIWAHRHGGLELVARAGDHAPGTPDGVNFSASTSNLSLNKFGQIAFSAGLTGPGGITGPGIWSEGSGGLTLVTRRGDPAPGMPEGSVISPSLGFFQGVAFNNAGQTAFGSMVTGGGVDATNNRGIWLGTPGDLSLVIRKGDHAPGTPSGVNFDGVTGSWLALNDAGQVAFYGGLTGAGVDSTNRDGLWSGAPGSLAMLARTGDHAPGTEDGVVFGDFTCTCARAGVRTLMLNAAGQTAFQASFGGNGTGGTGIWATDRNGALQLVARTGNLLEVAPGDFRAINNLFFLGDGASAPTATGNSDGRPSAFNNLGQLAFGAQFTDGTSGIFVSNRVAVPEPSTLLLLCFGSLAVLWRRRGLVCAAILVAVVSVSFADRADAITINTVPVGNPGNAPDTRYDAAGFGSVGYNYRIGKIEVSNAQYVEFLNGVAASDPYQLYGSGGVNGIARSGSSGSYAYSVKANAVGQGPGGSDYSYGDKPVVNVTWYDAIRFANWLHNGMGNADTENGAYTLLGGTPTPTNGLSITRNPGARWWLPSEDEWYKAAYFDPSGVYYDYPTATNSVPDNNLPSADTGNSANFYDNGFTTGNNSYPMTDGGAYALSDSPYGTFDQGGNVWEWNETLPFGSSRGLRGGSWGDSFGFSFNLHASFRNATVPTAQFSTIGFRVASTVPEPSTLLLLCFGGLAVLWRRRRLVCALILTAVFTTSGAAYTRAENIEWVRQLGTSADDRSNGVSADGLGNIYISGFTGASLGGPTAGSTDAFVSKYDAAGTLQWSRQLGTGFGDGSNGVSADGLGNVYISGETDGSLGGPSAGSIDAFVSKYDAAGTLQWSRQLGTTADDSSFRVKAEGLGNVYISGFTAGSLGGPNVGSNDAYVSKYDASGTLQWTQQLGTSAFDESYGVSADGLGGVYISGRTLGSLGGPNASSFDAFVAKIADPAVPEPSTLLLLCFGSLAALWRRRRVVCAAILAAAFITSSADHARGESVEWTRQLGTSGGDSSNGVSADGLGNVYFSGYTAGSLGGPNAGSSDAFVVKIVDSVVPEPSTLLLLCFGSLAVLWRRRGLICASILAAAFFGHHGSSARADSAVAWGNNFNGQLGDGTSGNVKTLVPVIGMDSGVTAVAAGGSHSLAVQNGGAYAWGYNFLGQLGDGTRTTRLTPVAVSGMDSGVTAVATSGRGSNTGHSKAVQNGALYAWGSNFNGELGDGTSGNFKTTPVPVIGMDSGVTAVANGLFHSLAVKDGELYAWGANSWGQLGNGTIPTIPTDPRTYPTPARVIDMGSGVTAIAAGDYFNLAVKDGGVYSWGENTDSQLGHGSGDQLGHPTPELVAGLESGATAVAAGSEFSLAVVNGSAYYWGGYTNGTLVQVDPTNVSNIVAVAGTNCCTAYALSSDGRLWYWNVQTGPSSLQLVLPPPGYKFTSITAGSSNHALATLAAVPEPSTLLLLCFGSLAVFWRRRGLVCASILVAALFALPPQPAHADSAVAWGNNFYGQLGVGTTTPDGTPMPVSDMDSGVTAVAAGGHHSLAIQNGGAFAWGFNINGQIGDGSTTNRYTPVAVTGLSSGLTAIAAGGIGQDIEYSLAVQNGGVYAWGRNSDGQLGNGTFISSNTPVAVSGMESGVTAVAAGDRHNLAVKDGGLYAWGSNISGQLGNGTVATCCPLVNGKFPTPAAVIGMGSGVTAIAAGRSHSLAVKDGGVYAWGSNSYGTLGQGSIGGTNPTPQLVTGLESGATAVAAGEQFSLAVVNGGVYHWSVYTGGTPVQVDPTNLSNMVAVAEFNCCTAYALSSDGSLWSWNAQTSLLTPQQLLPPTGYKFTSIDAGYNHLVATLAAVPEPSTFVLAAAALGLCIAQRRRQRAQNDNRIAARTTRRRQQFSIALVLGLSASLCNSAATAHAAEIRTVALTGQQVPGAPDGTVFTSFLNTPGTGLALIPLVLNDAGQTAFLGGYSNGSNFGSGILSEGSGSLNLVAATGQQAPGLPDGATYMGFERILINESGATAFSGRFSLDNSNWGVWSSESGTSTLIVRTGEQAAGMPAGVHHSFQEIVGSTLNSLVMNNAGQTAFGDFLTGPGVDSSNGVGIWARRHGNFELVARHGDHAPGTPDGVTFSYIPYTSAHALNNAGQVAFYGGDSTGQGIWSEGTGSLALLAHTGSQAPGMPDGAVFNRFLGLSFHIPALNGAGQTAFVGRVTGGSVNSTNNEGIWLGMAGDLSLVVRSGDHAPGAPSGATFRVGGLTSLALNDAGQIAFFWQLSEDGVTFNSFGLWSGAPLSLALVARTGEHAPGTEDGVVFAGFGSSRESAFGGLTLMLNAAGQTAFIGLLTGSGIGASNDKGIWATDSHGALQLIAREGDLLEVAAGDFRTISGLGFLGDYYNSPTGNSDGRPSLFNNHGQVAFSASFTDGTSGIFVSNRVAVPEPSTLLLLCFGSLAALWRQRLVCGAVL